MAECSHQDESRKKVGITALGVAGLRAIETRKGDGALIKDPFAEQLAGAEGFSWIDDLGKKHPKAAEAMVDGLAIRTKKIDEEICKCIMNGFTQVCVPGAGLDCRVWRIDSCFSDNLDKLGEVSWFELDFPEMFDLKLNTVKSVSSSSTVCKRYCPIRADLSLPSWDDLLRGNDHGYDVNTPTIWLLEGFTSYLTAEEVSVFFTKMSACACDGSKLIATFKAKNEADKIATISYHRNYYSDPTAFVAPFGWRVDECELLSDIGKGFGRLPAIPQPWEGYRILIATRDANIVGGSSEK